MIRLREGMGAVLSAAIVIFATGLGAARADERAAPDDEELECLQFVCLECSADLVESFDESTDCSDRLKLGILVGCIDTCRSLVAWKNDVTFDNLFLRLNRMCGPERLSATAEATQDQQRRTSPPEESFGGPTYR